MTGGQLAAAMALLAIGGTGGPQPRFTSPVVNPGFNVIGCVAQNVGTQPALVEATLYDDEGGVVDSGDAEVPPGRSVEIVGSSAIVSGYCGFNTAAELEEEGCRSTAAAGNRSEWRSRNPT